MANVRYDYIDIAKGIGIIIVVFRHSICYDLMFWAGGISVPLFFVLSGYTSKTFSLKKKAKALLVPYVIFNVLIIGSAYILGFNELRWEDFVGVLYSRYSLYPLEEHPNIVFLGSGNAPLWFLTAMFSSFILFYLLCLSGKHWKWIAISYLLIAWLLDFLPVLLPWSLDTAFLMALFMYAGKFMKEHKLIYGHKIYLLILSCVYVLCVLINGHENLSVRDYGRSIFLALIAGIIGSMSFIWFCRYLERTFVKNFFVEIGKNSLVIFCFQIPLLHAFKMLVPSEFWTLAPHFVMGTLQVIFVLATGYALSRIQKKFFPFI